MTKVFRNGKVHVLKRMCKTCIFRPGNLMHLEPGRAASMVAGATKAQSCIPCHDTTQGPAPAICRGFYERHPTQPIQIASRLGYVVFVEPPRSHLK